MKKVPNSPLTRKVHWFFFGVIITIFCLAVYDCGFIPMLINYTKFLTLWGVGMTFIYLSMELLDFGSPGLRKNFLLILLCMESVITLFYWAFMHSVKPQYSSLFVLRLYTDHIYPFIFVVGEYLRTGYKMEYYILHYLVVVVLSYLLTNLAYTFGTGEPVYEIVTWDNMFSVVFAIASIVFMFFSFFFWKFVGGFFFGKKGKPLVEKGKIN